MKVNYPETIILKSDGANASEKYLSALCSDTFLSLWSYPNLYRDKGRTGSKGDGKELCDLLVVFEKHVIMFSDKMCIYPSTEDVQLNWSRWYRKAIRDAATQLYGAERYMKMHSDKIYLDKLCQQKLPINVPDESDAIYHHIVVAHGASTACQQFFNGGSGSLVIDTTTQGDRHWSLEDNDIVPFHVGRVNPEHGFTHVFDDYSLGVVMQTLDTVTDFIAYLECKEKFLQTYEVISPGEEELLAEYLQKIDSDGRHCFVENIDESDNISVIIFPEGSWQEFCVHPSRLAQVEENKISYMWDSLIEKFLYHITTGTSESMSHPIVSEQEIIFRIMAKESRTHRRMLSTSLLDFMNKTPIDARATRLVYTEEPATTCYLFLLLPHLFGTYKEHREIRKTLLLDYVHIAKIQYPDALDIIGIAFDNYNLKSQNNSEDVVYLDARHWTKKEQEQAKVLEQEYIENGLLSSRNYFHKIIKEYPDIELGKFKGRHRNLPCPCGSGMKYKRCCGFD